LASAGTLKTPTDESTAFGELLHRASAGSH
jgi:hypothetical protein